MPSPKKKVRGASRAKGESLTVRLHPRLKYGLELLARKQHRTLTTVVEWALTKALEDEREGLIKHTQGGEDINILHQVWDPEESDRFVNLAMCCPELLSYEEELVWKVITSHIVDVGEFGCEEGVKYFFEYEGYNVPRYSVIRENWEKIHQAAAGESVDFT
jgi:hypothetical protein